MSRYLLTSILAGMLCCAGSAWGQVPLAGKIAYSSLPSPDGGRHWVSLGWKVQLHKEKTGWACTLSSGPMVALVPSDKLHHDIAWQDQSYQYGAVIYVSHRASELYAWHQGPAAQENPSLLKVGVNVRQAGELQFPIAQRYRNKDVFTMEAPLPRDVLFHVIFPAMENNEMFHLRIDNTAYGLGAMNFRISLPQFRECLQWMDQYDAEGK